VPPTRTQVVPVGRARLHVEQSGSGEPLLLITGFAISAAVFEPVLPLYARRFAVTTYDNRGAGRSSGARPGLSVGQLAADAAGLLDALGIDSAHVYGLSMGGMIAQELALRFPHRVRTLVLGGTTPGGPHAVLPLREVAALAAELPGTPGTARARALAAALFSPEFREREPAQVRALLAYFARHRARPTGLAAHWWATVYHDTWSRLPRLERPTLVLHGGADALVPLGSAQRLADRIPGATLAVVPGAGHAYLLEQPELSYAVFTDWLDGLGPVAPGAAPSPLAARVEPLSRNLTTGALRTGRSALRVLSGRR
jgi:3-oxoadipate enol-lactonase